MSQAQAVSAEARKGTVSEKSYGVLEILRDTLNEKRRATAGDSERKKSLISKEAARYMAILAEFFTMCGYHTQLGRFYSKPVGHLNQEEWLAFFGSEAFEDLPSIILHSYITGYVLHEKEISIQDLIDIYHISELLPYCTLFVTDKDQHRRLNDISRHRMAKGVLRQYLQYHCKVSSKLEGELPPRRALRGLFSGARTYGFD